MRLPPKYFFNAPTPQGCFRKQQKKSLIKGKITQKEMRMAALLKASFSLSWSFFPQQPVILQHLKSLSSAFTWKQNVSCSESRHQIDVHMNFGHFSWPQPRLLCLCNKHCEPALKRLFWSVPSSSRGSKQKCLQNNIKWRARARWEVLVIEDSHYYSCQVWPYNNVSPQLPNLPIKKRKKERKTSEARKTLPIFKR